MKAPEVLRILSDKCRRMHLSYATEKSYAHWAQSYISALSKYPKAWTSERKAEAFLTGLAHRDVAAATQNQALNAIAFLYREVHGTPLGTVDALRVKRPATVREALSIEDTRALLGAMGGLCRLSDSAGGAAALRVRAARERAAGAADEGRGSRRGAADHPFGEGEQGSHGAVAAVRAR